MMSTTIISESVLTLDLWPIYRSGVFMEEQISPTGGGSWIFESTGWSHELKISWHFVNWSFRDTSLATCCADNNLSLNVEKTKESVVDFRRAHTQHVPRTINSAAVERVSSTKFLGVTEVFFWSTNTASLAIKAHQHHYFLCKLRRARTPIMCTFYRGTIESMLTSCITVWYGACTASCHRSLQHIVRAAEIIGASLHSLQDIYNTRPSHKALCIACDPTQPSQSFFSLLPSGRRLCRLRNSFIHQAVRKLNSLPALPSFPLLPPLTPSAPCAHKFWTLTPQLSPSTLNFDFDYNLSCALCCVYFLYFIIFIRLFLNALICIF